MYLPIWQLRPIQRGEQRVELQTPVARLQSESSSEQWHVLEHESKHPETESKI